MATRTVPALTPRSVAKGASRISHSKLPFLIHDVPRKPQILAPQLEQPVEPTLVMLDDNLGAMRGLAAVVIAYLVIAVAALGGVLAWNILR